MLCFAGYTFCSLLLMVTVRSFYVPHPDYTYEDLDIYPIFQGIELRDTIRSIIEIYESAFFSQLSVLLFGLVAILITMFE